MEYLDKKSYLMFVDVPLSKIKFNGGSPRIKKSLFQLSCKWQQEFILISLYISVGTEQPLEFTFKAKLDELRGEVDIWKLSENIALHKGEIGQETIFGNTIVQDRVISLAFDISESGVTATKLVLAVPGSHHVDDLSLEGKEEVTDIGDWKQFFKLNRKSRR